MGPGQFLGFTPPDYADPTSEEFRRRQQALQVGLEAPKTGSAFGRAEAATFGGLESAEGVGREQAQLAAALRAQAEGKAPSLAAMQYAKALEQSQAAAASQLASARGLSPAQAQRLMLTQQAQSRAEAATASAQLRLQEQQAAQAALGNLLGQQRQQALLGGQLAAGMYGTAGGLGTTQAIEQARLKQAAQQQVLQQSQLEQQQRAGLTAAIIGAGAEAGATIATGKARGGKMDAVVPGKAKYEGDTRSNDTVPALLSPGEIVLPRSVAQSEEAPEKAKKFVEAIKKQKRPSPKAFAEAVARLRDLESRLDAMEALADLEAEEEG